MALLSERSIRLVEDELRRLRAEHLKARAESYHYGRDHVPDGVQLEIGQRVRACETAIVALEADLRRVQVDVSSEAAVADGLTFSDEERTFVEPTPEKLAAIIFRHLELYRKRLNYGKAPVNVEETRALLRLWEGMAGKTFGELTPEERAEVEEAIDDG